MGICVPPSPLVVRRSVSFMYLRSFISTLTRTRVCYADGCSPLCTPIKLDTDFHFTSGSQIQLVRSRRSHTQHYAVPLAGKRVLFRSRNTIPCRASTCISVYRSYRGDQAAFSRVGVGTARRQFHPDVSVRTLFPLSSQLLRVSAIIKSSHITPHPSRPQAC